MDHEPLDYAEAVSLLREARAEILRLREQLRLANIDQAVTEAELNEARSTEE